MRGRGCQQSVPTGLPNLALIICIPGQVSAEYFLIDIHTAREEPMQTKRLLVLLQAFVLLFAVSCNKLGKPDDAAITTDIKAKMFSDPSLKAANVEVSAHGGEVTLSGQVPDDSARLAAYKIASESKGVSKVNDQMSVPSAQSAAAQPATNPVPDPAAVTGAPEKVQPKRKPSSPKPSKSPSTATETAAPAPADAPA